MTSSVCLHYDSQDRAYPNVFLFFLFYRIIHLVFTLTFHFFVLRHVEKYLGWLRTSLIYLGSGLGGNIVSAVFVPYNPEVRGRKFTRGFSLFIPLMGIDNLYKVIFQLAFQIKNHILCYICMLEV